MPQYRLTFNRGPVTRALRAAAARGNLLAAEHVLGVSNDRVPLDEGALQRTGTASVDRADLTAAISYSGPYAVPQHERMDYRHAPGRQAKFLESALNDSRSEAGALIAAEMRRALE